MVALPLIDVVLSSPDKLDQSRAVTTQVIESALSELEQVQKLDETLIPDSKTASDGPTVALVRGMYEQWAQQAEALLDRVERLQSRSGPIPGYQSLRNELGRIKAMLSVSLEEMELARQDLAAGRLVSAEEVRRELRVGIH
jgi:hypothetical protein